MMHKAWCSIEEVPYCFPRPSIKFQGHKGQKIDDLDQIWARLLGRLQLSNPSDLPCLIQIPVFRGHLHCNGPYLYIRYIMNTYSRLVQYLFSLLHPLLHSLHFMVLTVPHLIANTDYSLLTHSNINKMANILQMIFSSVYSWMGNHFLLISISLQLVLKSLTDNIPL